jgi:hypothetical protein
MRADRNSASFALLVNAANPVLAEPTIAHVQEAARTLGLQLHVLRASTERDIDAAFATLTELHTAGLVIGADNFFNSRSEQLAVLSLRRRAQQRSEITLGGNCTAPCVTFGYVTLMKPIYGADELEGTVRVRSYAQRCRASGNRAITNLWQQALTHNTISPPQRVSRPATAGCCDMVCWLKR